MDDPTIQAVLDCILQDDLEGATALLSRLASTSRHRSAESPAIHISARLSRLRRDLSNGLLTREQSLVERAQIRGALLHALDDARPKLPASTLPGGVCPEAATGPAPPGGDLTTEPDSLLFLSAAPQDMDIANQMRKHLRPVLASADLEIWSRPTTGKDADPGAAARALARARIVVLLLSADFLATRQTMSEARAAFARADCVVVPVLARPCAWSAVPMLSGKTILPRNELAISSHTEPDAAWVEVVEEVGALLRHSGP